MDEEERNKLEDESRRMEAKRRKGTSGGRSTKRRKLEKLTGWGDAVEDRSQEVNLDIFTQGVVMQSVTEAPRHTFVEVIEEEVSRSAKPTTKKKIQISTEVRKAKFIYNKKGKLKDDEMKEIRRTHRNIFDWVKPEVEIQMMKKETADDEDRVNLEALERQDRLERMEERRRLWEAEYICKVILTEMLEEMRQQYVYRMAEQMVLEMVDRASSAVEHVRDLITEMVTSAEEEGSFQVMVKELMRRGVAERMVKVLTRRMKAERLKKKMMLEKAWKKMMPGSIDDIMEWEDQDMEEWMTSLDLDNGQEEEMDIDLDEEEDWLDALMMADMRTEDTLELEGRMKTISIEDQMDDMEVEVEEDFLTWLVTELKELSVGEEILECIRTMACHGNCDCDVVEECLSTAHCPGNCNCVGNREVETLIVQDDMHGNIMQPVQDSTQVKDTHCVRCPDNCRGVCRNNIKPDIAENSLITVSNNTQAITGSSDTYIVKCVHSPAYPISHHQECPDAFAGIGLVVDGVGPKKLKTSESQQPRPAVGPLLGVVRGA